MRDAVSTDCKNDVRFIGDAIAAIRARRQRRVADPVVCPGNTPAERQHRCWSTPQGRGPKRAPSSLLVSVALRELGQWLRAEYSAADQPVSERHAALLK